jgi:hypothetical protein
MRFGFRTREDRPAADSNKYNHNEKKSNTIVAIDEISLRPSRNGSQQPSQQPLLFQQDLEYRGHESIERSQPPGKPWRPLMLRRWVLITFAVLFILLIGTLEIILKVSTDRNGFGPAETNLYYVWTYGPTVGKYTTYDDTGTTTN